MLQPLLDFINGLDSFRKVAIVALAALTALVVYFGYLAAQHYDESVQWRESPHFIKVSLPCALYQIRNDYYMQVILFNRPDDVLEQVFNFGTFYGIDHLPDDEQFDTYCRSLVSAIFSSGAENQLAPYHSGEGR